MGSASFGTCMSIFRTKLFIVLSSIALLAVLIIQVNWIVGTARIKEEIFNEKANIVIAKTAEALSADTTTCRQMEACMGKSEIHKTDSLFSNFMSFYDLKMDYSFEVKSRERMEAMHRENWRIMSTKSDSMKRLLSMALS